MTTLFKILLLATLIRRRPTSSRPRKPQIFPPTRRRTSQATQTQAIATSSHLVPTSSRTGGRPQQRRRPRAPHIFDGDEVAETSWTPTKTRTTTASRDEVRDDVTPRDRTP